ncbi:MAG: response regulator transcription factor [Patescibacteria group bacterium]|nr:response regulator transcription factor [Patescibacteria group bacterium]
MKENTIRILIVDDHALLRTSLATLIDYEADMEVVGQAENGRQAVELCWKLQPNVIIMDLQLPRLNGIEAIRQIMSRQCAAILVLSMHSDSRFVDDALAVGATGYLLKTCSFEELMQGIRETHRGKRLLSPEIATKPRLAMAQPGSVGSAQDNRRSALTVREAEVLQLIAEGLSNKMMSAELGLSVKTVEKHRQNLMCKLDIHETAGLTRYAIAQGIISGPAALDPA